MGYGLANSVHGPVSLDAAEQSAGSRVDSVSYSNVRNGIKELTITGRRGRLNRAEVIDDRNLDDIQGCLRFGALYSHS